MAGATPKQPIIGSDLAGNVYTVTFSGGSLAGNADLRRAIHTRFAQLKYSCSIGGTHVTDLGSGKDLVGVKPVLFFAPAQVKKRTEEWGGAEFGKRMLMAWQAFTKTVTTSNPTWLQSQYQQGLQATSQVYAQVLAGKGDPRMGHMLSLSSSVSEATV